MDQATREKRLEWLGMALAILHIIAAASVFAGWWYHIPALKGAMMNSVIAPNTALLFLLAGIAVILLRWPKIALLGRLIGALILAFSAVLLAEHLTGVDAGIDRLVLASRLGDWPFRDVPQGRIAVPSALAFLLVGLGLLWSRRRSTGVLDFCATGCLAIGYMAVLGYVYGLRPFYGYVMALPTALLILFTSAMLIITERASHIREILVSEEAGGILMRRLAPAIMLLLPVLGWLRLQAQQRGLVPLEFGTALLVVVSVFIFTFTAFRTASLLNKLDAQRKYAQAALIRTEKLAAAGRLASTIAHEINNPLAAAINTLYLARQQSLDENTAALLATAERELMRVAAVARQSLGFYRGPSRPAAVDLRSSIQDVVDLVSTSAAPKGIRVEGVVANALFAKANPGELRQILANLALNSIDATPAGGFIRLTASAVNAQQVQVTVEDNGCGIPKRDQPQIFEPFFTTKENVGTGLGLFVVKELVTKNHGSVSVASSTDATRHGTTFTVMFPAADEKASGTASE